MIIAYESATAQIALSALCISTLDASIISAHGAGTPTYVVPGKNPALSVIAANEDIFV